MNLIKNRISTNFKTIFINNITKRSIFNSSTHRILDIKSNYLYIVEDSKNQLPYFRQIETKDGQKGIVLKIQQTGKMNKSSEFDFDFNQPKTYIAMYQPIKKQSNKELEIKNANNNWKNSFDQAFKEISEKNQKGIIDVLGNFIVSDNRQQSSNQSNINQEQRRRLATLNPVLNVSYDLLYGNMINFTGCLGSKKTQTLEDISKHFSLTKNHISFYINASSYSEANKFFKNSNTISLNNGDFSNSHQADVGIYMLTLKTIVLANKLKNAGFDVLLAIDNFKFILNAEWHLLQLLQGGNKVVNKKFGDSVNYNSLKIAPLSILNQIYSSCTEKGKSLSKKKQIGSLTSIIITQKETNELTPEMTPFSNNLKHLGSLSQNVEFPLQINYNKNSIKNTNQATQQQKSFTHNLGIIRNEINNFIQEKKNTDIKRQIYKSDVRDAPWDYYTLLDAEWWLNGLKQIKVKDRKQEESLIKWIGFNIEQQIVPNWKISCKASFQQYQKHLTNRTESNEIYQEFINEARLLDFFSPYKKDYLK